MSSALFAGGPNELTQQRVDRPGVGVHRSDRVASVLGLARRRPEWGLPKVTWAKADVTCSDLVALFRGADVVVHLAWVIQPSHRPEALRAGNVDGSARVWLVTAMALVPTLCVVLHPRIFYRLVNRVLVSINQPVITHGAVALHNGIVVNDRALVERHPALQVRGELTIRGIRYERRFKEGFWISG